MSQEDTQNDRNSRDDEDSELEPAPLDPPSSDSDSDADSDDEPITYTRPDGTIKTISPYDFDSENTPEANIARFTKLLDSKRLRQEEEEELEDVDYHEDLFDFPPDPENWCEEDLEELWADAPIEITKTGWDPTWVDDDELEIINDEFREGRDPTVAPFYVPYRKSYPVIPDNNYDISNPKSVIEEFDRIEEFLIWVSFIFPDGSSYEGTVWDDLAHGKGVYVAEKGLVRYEGEWLRNDMEGHGVVEVDIPTPEPIPGSKLEAKMRAEGRIISRDFMSPEDREWLEKDIEDSILLADGNYEIPFYENEEWVNQFGEKPEKGRYRYAGQWKHGRMHGCGVYEVNERTTYGRFYFGNYLEDSAGCTAEVSGLHAGIAEVAAAKARMFVNKPDGMIREYCGPYSDPQHPYLYEEDDVWMAPGFINQFYEVPDYWKMYVHEVDEEREMWLNSFYKAPLRLPMPSELEYWWEKEEKPEFVLLNKEPEPDPNITVSSQEKPEFVLLNKEPEPDPNDPSKQIYTEDPLILHTPTGRLINYIDDEEHGIRFFWQPPVKEGEDINPDEIEFLPTGFDEFYGREVVVDKGNTWDHFVKSVENACKPILDGLEKWGEEKTKSTELEMELLEKELELVEAEISLKEANEDYDEVLELLQKEEEQKAAEEGVEEEEEVEEKDVSIPEPMAEFKKTSIVAEEEEKDDDSDDDDDDDEDDDADSSSFAFNEEQTTGNDQKESTVGKPPFASVSLSLAGSNLVSLVPSKLLNSFSKWSQRKVQVQKSPLTTSNQFDKLLPMSQGSSSVSLPRSVIKSLKMRCTRPMQPAAYIPKLRPRNRSKLTNSVDCGREFDQFNVLSLHTPMPM